MRKWIGCSSAFLLCLCLASCGSRGQTPDLTPPAVAGAPTVADPHEGQERDLERIERDLANARAAAAGYEAEAKAWREAADEARKEKIRAVAMWVAMIAGLGALAGVALVCFGHAKLGASLILAGTAVGAAAMTVSWLVGLLAMLAPFIGVAVLAALGFVLWKQRRALKEAVNFGNKALEGLTEDQIKDIKDWARERQKALKVDNEIRRAMPKEKQ